MLKNTPVGCFSGKAEKKKNALAKGEFRALRVQFSKATFSKAELAAGGSEQLRCSALPPPLPLSRKRPKLLVRVWFVTVFALCLRRRFS